MYDFANSGYTTVILTAVFSTYFVGVVGARASWATLAWTAALSLSYLLIMLTMPAGRPRRRARGQAAAAVRQHRRLRRRHAGADPGRAGRCLAGAGRHRHFELLLLRGRIRGRGVPAGTGQARRAGARVGLGLELRLLRRHADAGTVAGRGDAGRGPRHDRRAFRALGHRGHLLGVRAGRPAVLLPAARARPGQAQPAMDLLRRWPMPGATGTHFPSSAGC